MIVRVLKSSVKIKTKKRTKKIKIEKESNIVRVMKVKIKNYWKIQGFQKLLTIILARKKKIKKRKN